MLRHRVGVIVATASFVLLCVLTIFSTPDIPAEAAPRPTSTTTVSPPSSITTTSTTVVVTTTAPPLIFRPRASRVPTTRAPIPAGDAKAFIYDKESGNNPASVNGGGCVGLGQNCPDKHGNVAVIAACPNWQTDYACQDAWFTGYMEHRYGTWEKAKAFWVIHHWW